MLKSQKKVLVVGGGFAGIRLVKSLARDRRFQVTLVDINNYHFFPPLLYQVGTGFIESSNITYPFRRMFQEKDNLRFFMGNFQKVNPEEKFIDTDHGRLYYDDLVFALGTETNYFGMEDVRENAFPMKTIDDAINLRNHILLTLEKAVREENPLKRSALLNIVIAGGGPTGVEIAGMLAEMAHNIARKEYPEIAGVRGNIHLIDAAPTLLGPMRKTAQQEAFNVLSKLGVQIKLNVAVKGYQQGAVMLDDGSSIPTDMFIWTSGVTGKPLPGISEEYLSKGRRVQVDAFNNLKADAHIFAIGDICLQTSDPAYPQGHPQLAQVAIQQGQLLAKNLKRRESGKAMEPFRYNNKGSMAIISKYKAVADLPKVSFKGFFAWLVWLFIHIIPLAGFRNKVSLSFSWFWSFITNDPTLRLIVRPTQKKKTSSQTADT